MKCIRCGRPMENHRDKEKAKKGFRTCPRCFLTYSPEACYKNTFAVIGTLGIKKEFSNG